MLDKLVPVAVATIPATVPVPVPPAETILIGTEIELLAVARLIRCATFIAEPCAELIVMLAVPEPETLPIFTVPPAGVTIFTFGEKVKPTLLPRTIGPVKVCVVEFANTYPLVLK